MIPFPEIGPDLFSFEIFGFTVALRYYALAYIFGVIIGWRIAVAAMKRPMLWPNDQAPMTLEQVESFITWLVIGIIAGGRLGFVFFYQPAFFWENPGAIIRVWDGGMAFHGGLLGVVLVAAFFAWRHKINPWSLGDIIAVCTPPGLFLGRAANFINGELWGRGTDVPWSFVFPDPRSHVCPGIEGICARHPSQLYEALLEGLILGLILLYLAWRRGWFKTPGQLIGLFLAGYGIGRFIVEFFRQADAQFMTPSNPMGYAIQFGDYGLQMGQLLSLPMVILGLAIMIYARRRKALPA